MTAAASVLAVLPDGPDSSAALRIAGMTSLPLHVVAGADRWEQALALVEASEDEAVLLLDETAVPLRPIVVDDLIIDGCAVAYVTEDREYWTDPPVGAAERRRRQDQVRRIAGTPEGSPILDARGPIILCPAIVRLLRAGVLEPRGWLWRDMLAAVPDVSCWYAAWLATTGFAGVTPREPAFRTCLTPGERASLIVRGITEEDVARAYVGYVGELPAPSAHWLAETAPSSQVMHAAMLRPYLRMPRLRRFMGST